MFSSRHNTSTQSIPEWNLKTGVKPKPWWGYPSTRPRPACRVWFSHHWLPCQGRRTPWFCSIAPTCVSRFWESRLLASEFDHLSIVTERKNDFAFEIYLRPWITRRNLAGQMHQLNERLRVKSVHFDFKNWSRTLVNANPSRFNTIGSGKTNQRPRLAVCVRRKSKIETVHQLPIVVATLLDYMGGSFFYSGFGTIWKASCTCLRAQVL